MVCHCCNLWSVSKTRQTAYLPCSGVPEAFHRTHTLDLWVSEVIPPVVGQEGKTLAENDFIACHSAKVSSKDTQLSAFFLDLGKSLTVYKNYTLGKFGSALLKSFIFRSLIPMNDNPVPGPQTAP